MLPTCCFVFVVFDCLYFDFVDFGLFVVGDFCFAISLVFDGLLSLGCYLCFGCWVCWGLVSGIGLPFVV